MRGDVRHLGRYRIVEVTLDDDDARVFWVRHPGGEEMRVRITATPPAHEELGEDGYWRSALDTALRRWGRQEDE